MTPITMASEVIGAACDCFVQRLGGLLQEKHENCDPIEFYFTHFFESGWDDESTDGDDKMAAFFKEIDEKPMEAASFALLHAMIIATAYAIQAMKAEKDSALAWSYAASAKYWAGIIRASMHKEGGSEIASQMAKLRHKENYALTEEVEKYWRENVDPSLSAQKAAEQVLLARVVPLSHKKIAEIISRLRKQKALRSE